MPEDDLEALISSLFCASSRVQIIVDKTHPIHIHMTKHRIIAPITALPMLMIGCAHQSQQVLNPNELGHTSPSLIADVNPSAQSAQVLSELSMSSLIWQNTNPTPSITPQLVAGDWLAWQCAIAGSYWDMPFKNAPAYAEAFDAPPID